LPHPVGQPSLQRFLAFARIVGNEEGAGHTIKRLHPLFVAEITGVDLTMPLSREDFRTIWDAFNEHQILVFRDQAFVDESQIAFSRRFGELETMVAHPGNDWNPGHISA
jgi:alpha-ketoglutarate-dependent taurine dioxygenase